MKYEQAVTATPPVATRPVILGVNAGMQKLVSVPRGTTPSISWPRAPWLTQPPSQKVVGIPNPTWQSQVPPTRAWGSVTSLQLMVQKQLKQNHELKFRRRPFNIDKIIINN